MVEFRLPSLSPTSSESASSEEVEAPTGRYNPADHGYTLGLPDDALTPPVENGGPIRPEPATPTRPLGLTGWPRLKQSPLPVPPPPGTWPLSPMVPSSSAAANRASLAVPQTPKPPGAFPPVSPYSNRIAPAPEPADEVRTALIRLGIPDESPKLLPRKLQRPVGLRYSGSSTTMAPMGVPTSPQRQGEQRSWVTWWHDGATRNFIPAIATEIVGDAKDIDWEHLMYLLHVTSHPHIVRLLDGSHMPKRDPRTGDFVQCDGQLMEKSLTDLAQLAGWNEQQWKRQRREWQLKGIWSEPDVTPGVFPHPFLVWERVDGKPLSIIFKKRPDGVAESFIWYFLISLLEALRWLHYGQPSRPRRDGSEWKAVIHNNINPDNIWLSRPLKPDVKYGTIKLGNFSRAVVLDVRSFGPLESPMRKDSFNAEDSERRPHHEHYDAPELSWLFDTDPKMASLLQETDVRPEDSTTECLPIGGRSDIWSLGAVVVALMGGIWIDPGNISLRRWQKVSREKTFVLQTVQLFKMGGKRWDRSLLPPGYSERLRAVLEKMLTLDPKKRIDALKAHALVKKEYAKWMADENPEPESDDEDDAIDSGPEDDDDPFTDTRPPRPTGGRPGGQPPPGNDSDSDDDWRPLYRPPRTARTPLFPRKPGRPPIRKQNVGPLRDRTRFSFFGRPRLSSTAGLVRVGAGFQRQDRPNPFDTTRPGGRPSRTSGQSAPGRPFDFRTPRADGGQQTQTPVSISSQSSSEFSESPSPKRKTPPGSDVELQNAGRAQRPRQESPDSPLRITDARPLGQATATETRPQRLRITPREELLARVRQNSAPLFFQPAEESDVESLGEEEEQQQKWTCAVQ
ncbi:Putative protein kinase [Septoria linicola]|uniref:non-specific serine/threonine protein kinase n=1 Tax=Septoria linicola TaxID=215465 RepID=A0A9Q9EEK3_9PEZI|nr:putative protein kinase [Septoria linicola]USW47009.1 Putative protein kinase [Septoria linicola]